jgi:hypothetical protein
METHLIDDVENICIDLMLGNRVSDDLAKTMLSVSPSIDQSIMNLFNTSTLIDQLRIIKDLTRDLNWGRVVMFIVLCRENHTYKTENRENSENHSLAHATARLISPWIRDNGGFDEMIRFFNPALPPSPISFTTISKLSKRVLTKLLTEKFF